VANFVAMHPSANREAHCERRRAYYNRFPAFWATLPGVDVEEYAVYGALEVSREHASALRLATARLYQVMTRLATSLQRAEDQPLLDMGIPRSALPYVHVVVAGMSAVMCGRFEFAFTEQGPKLLEFNAETPTFVVELFQMNGQVCADFALPDPNLQCREQLARAVHASIKAGISWLRPRLWRQASVFFSSYVDSKEERNTTEFYRDLLGPKKRLAYRGSFCGLDQLRVTDDCLLTAEGKRVDVLYKMYPTEHLLLDEAPDGTLVGLALMDLVCKRRLVVINPPTAFVLQNKALMALLWTAHLAKSQLFTQEEHGWIEQYLLPTYLSAQDAQGQPLFAGPYVVKPVYGREGASIAIRNSQEIVEQSPESLYNDQVMVYQQYVSLPQAAIQTEAGLIDVNLVHNCFIAGGQPSAIGIRGSQKLILDDNSYFVPVCHPF